MPVFARTWKKEEGGSLAVWRTSFGTKQREGGVGGEAKNDLWETMMMILITRKLHLLVILKLKIKTDFEAPTVAESNWLDLK